MPSLSVDNLLDCVRKSGLVEDSALKQTLADIRAQDGGVLPSDPAQMSQRLIDANLLTQWHVNKLLDGKFRGFFLGKYKLLRHIGSGGMSTVFLAEHTIMRRLRAIKVLPKARVNDSSYLARFLREAQATAALEHPNIVRCYDVDNEGDTHYIVMEYIEGQDLHSIVKAEGQLPFDRICSYVAQAARGFQFAHDNKFVHRDVKPANLLVDPRGIVKILDLGLALLSDDENASLTVAHQENVLGTADYLAPEQAINSHNIDARADIYALGCTMYFLLTGHPPFTDGSLAQRIARHQSQMPEDVLKDRPDCPRDLADICWKMIQKKPDRRYQKMQEVADALENWARVRGVTLPQQTSHSGPQPIVNRPAPAAPAAKATGSDSRRAPPKPAPPRPSVDGDTLADRARGETVKGPAKAPGSSRKLPAAKPLDIAAKKPPQAAGWPMAKSLPTGSSGDAPAPNSDAASAGAGNRAIPDYDKYRSAAKPASDKPAFSLDFGGKSSSSPSGKQPVVTLPSAAKGGAKLPVAWIAAGGVIAVVVLAVVIGVAMSFSQKPPTRRKSSPPPPKPGVRDTSEHRPQAFLSSGASA